METAKPLKIEFADYSIPPDAQIVDILMTPNTESGLGLLPAVRTQHLHTRDLPHGLHIEAVPWPLADLSTEGCPTETNLAVLVIWIPANFEPEKEPLLSAAKAFITGDYRGAAIPAQVTVELELSRILAIHFRQFASKDRVESFLRDGATYGYQLRVLLPSLFHLVGAPALPAEVADGLHLLRKRRNQVGHEHLAITRTEAAKMLLASLFGYSYISTYGPLLELGQE